MTSHGRATRAGRSGLAVAAAVLVALTAHVTGGGTAPPPALLLAVAALAWPVALLLVGRRPRLWRQAAVVGAAQAMLHGVFSLGAPAAGAATDPMAGMHGVPLTLAAAAPMPAMHDGAAMWWAHVTAWAITVLAWRFGEGALALLLEHLPVARLLVLLVPVVVGGRSARPAVPQRLPLPAAALLAAHRDRGPPLPA
ncbi:hypothetical protein [Amnibacterium endophyticum]|uniref:MFS transporter n=1 Tax=Amnibacterium endophyticum TaxID=2109337 RepID=A0ABW4LIP1_9MICO